MCQFNKSVRGTRATRHLPFFNDSIYTVQKRYRESERRRAGEDKEEKLLK